MLFWEVKMKKVIHPFIISIVAILLAGCAAKEISLGDETKDKFNFREENEFQSIVLNGDDILEIKIVPQTIDLEMDSIEFLFYFTEYGKAKLSELTKKNIGKFMYIYFDDLLFFSAIVREEISGGVLLVSPLSWKEIVILIENDAISPNDIKLIVDWLIKRRK
jgi:hypothetical protein